MIVGHFWRLSPVLTRDHGDRAFCIPGVGVLAGYRRAGSLAGGKRAARYLSMAVLEVRLLGELGVEFDGTAVALPNSRRACALLAWLALRPGPHSRSRLAALLWPDVLDVSARASLRSALWALRAAFGPAAGEYLRAGRDFAELAGDGLRVDVREFGRLLAAGCPAEAVALHRGDLLTQFDADWVLDARDEHRDRLCAAYAALAAAAESAGDAAAALDWAARRAAGRPLDERAARELIRLLMAGGDQAGAVAAYHRLAARLSAELGIGPAAETTRLVAAALRGPSPEAAPPGAASPATPWPAGTQAVAAGAAPEPLPGNGTGRLVGRDSELRALLRHWHAARAAPPRPAVSSRPPDRSRARRTGARPAADRRPPRRPGLRRP